MRHEVRNLGDASGGTARIARVDGVLDLLDVLQLATNLSWQSGIDLADERHLHPSRCRVLA